VVRAPKGRTALSRLGGVLISVGVLAVLFVVYEFVISDLVFDRSQSALLTGFKTGVPTTTLDSASSNAPDGTPVALLSIPRVGMRNDVVVEGTSPNDLKGGPGHLAVSPLPGEFGNSVIAARRTTYGGPFRALNELRAGDAIQVVTGQGSFAYVVSSTETINAGSAAPLLGTLDSRLTLVTSTPAYVPNGRLVVIALLQGTPIDVPTRPASSIAADDLGLASVPTATVVSAMWLLLLGVALGLALRLRTRWPASIVVMFAAPVVLGLAVLLFSGIDASLPGML
jgi:sortase A